MFRGAGKARKPGKPAMNSPFRIVEQVGVPIAEMSDEALMLAHGDGSEAAFEELVRRHQRGVLNYMYRMVQNRAVAEELAQDVFMALVRNAQRYQPTAKFTTYLYAIASNIVAKEWSKQKRRPRYLSLSKPEDDDEMDLSEAVGDERTCVMKSLERNEVSEAVNKALNNLSKPLREAFVMHRLREMSYDEVAEITGAPIGTIKSRVVRAERGLRPLLARFKEYFK